MVVFVCLHITLSYCHRYAISYETLNMRNACQGYPIVWVSQIKSILAHDDVIKWKHLCGISSVTGELPSQSQGLRALMFSLICAEKKNGWINNREAGDLRRHRAHYDTIVMDLSRDDCEYICHSSWYSIILRSEICTFGHYSRLCNETMVGAVYPCVPAYMPL